MNEIILYQAQEIQLQLKVRVEKESVWLSLNQLSELFKRDKSVISRHIRNVFKEKELIKDETVAKNATVQIEGEKEVLRQIEYYNLDVIISVGYRVKSLQGTQFRIWATRILKEYMLRGYSVQGKIDSIEEKLNEHDKKFDLILNTNIQAKQGIFYDGQIYDAYAFVIGIIRDAKLKIVIIDNYIDDTVLSMLTKRQKNVEVDIYTKNINKTLQLDISKHNEQYPGLKVYNFNLAHDRFMIIDNTSVFHIGASLKDLGKKWFAFSKIELDAKEMIKKLDLKK